MKPAKGVAVLASGVASLIASAVGVAAAASPTLGTDHSNWLYVANANDTITRLTLDPLTGAPSNPVDTPLPSSLTPFIPWTLAVDPQSQVLFAASAGLTGDQTNPGSGELLAVGIANGVVTFPPSPTVAPRAGLATALACAPLATGASVLYAQELAPDGTSTVEAFGFTSAPISCGSASAVIVTGEPSTSAGIATGLAVDPSGATLFLPDHGGGKLDLVPAAGAALSPPLAPATASFWAKDPTHAMNAPPNFVLTDPQGRAVYTVDYALGKCAITAFPAVAPGKLGAPVQYVPLVARPTGAAIDPTGQFIVLSEMTYNSQGSLSAPGVIFGSTVSLVTATIANPLTSTASVTLAQVGTPVALASPFTTPACCGPGAMAREGIAYGNGQTIAFNQGGTVLYALHDQGLLPPVSVTVQPQPVSTIQAFAVTATGITPLGSPVELPAGDRPLAIAVAK
jgi:hypothetical protein